MEAVVPLKGLLVLAQAATRPHVPEDGNIWNGLLFSLCVPYNNVGSIWTAICGPRNHISFFSFFLCFYLFVRFVLCWFYCFVCWLLQFSICGVLFPVCGGALKQVVDLNLSWGYVQLCVRCSGPLIIRALLWKCWQNQIYSVEMCGYRDRGNVHTECSKDCHARFPYTPLAECKSGTNQKLSIWS
jgi:hypothetical protein